MKKLKLNLAHEAGEILSKEEMKNVLGGAGSISDNCPGKTSFTKCYNNKHELVGSFESIGCPSNSLSRCPSDKGAVRVTCACTPGS